MMNKLDSGCWVGNLILLNQGEYRQITAQQRHECVTTVTNAILKMMFSRDAGGVMRPSDNEAARRMRLFKEVSDSGERYVEYIRQQNQPSD